MNYLFSSAVPLRRNELEEVLVQRPYLDHHTLTFLARALRYDHDQCLTVADVIEALERARLRRVRETAVCYPSGKPVDGESAVTVLQRAADLLATDPSALPSNSADLLRAVAGWIDRRC